MLENDTLELPEDFFYNVQKYKEHLFKWNKIHNLTGAKNEQMIDLFIYDAIYPLSFLPEIKTILDIGTGAGFPGLILALGLPQAEVTLVEPLSKRASFLQFIKADLKLKNVTVVKKRIEQMEPKLFELITSRAVTDTKMLLKLSENFRNSDSKLLFYKGEKVFQEIKNSLKEESIQYKIIEKKSRHYLLLGDNI